MFDGSDDQAKEVFGHMVPSCQFLTCTTGTALDMQVAYLCEDFTVPAGQQIIIIKQRRQDLKKQEDLHLNTDFWALVPITKELILRISLEDKYNEHVIPLKDVEKFLKLDYWPKKESGTVKELYSEYKVPSVRLELKK